MELFYFWINQSENNVFKNQEVLLTDKYLISFDDTNHKLNIEKNNLYYNIFETDVINNVSAIVGSNGVGKTTLLKYIYNRDVLPESTDEEEKEFFDVEKPLQVFEH